MGFPYCPILSFTSLKENEHGEHMIKQIEIKNFQSHRHTVIQFHDGVNAITGLSDSGKTAVLRALNWVITNKPSGDAFRSSWGGDTEVSIVLDNNYRISRKRTDSRNGLDVTDPDGVTSSHDAFNRSLPEEVLGLLNFSEINISYQQDSPFLISAPPGEVAQTLNKIANLDTIDLAISNIRKRSLEISRKLKSAEEQKDSIEKQLAKFSKVEEADELVIQLEQVELAIDQAKGKKDRLLALMNRVLQQRNAMTKPLTLLEASSDIGRAEEIAEKAEKLRGQVRAIKTILSAIAEAERKVEKFLPLLDAEPVLKSALDKENEVQKFQEQKAMLVHLLDAIFSKKEELEKQKVRLQELEKEFSEAMPDVCPLCGTNLTTEDHKHE